ncbi:hypothetical protein [Pseudomonas asiatica]|nr:hypothetical protein [Pseudomonas asiatica]
MIINKLSKFLYYESDAHHAGRIRAQDEAVLAQVGRIAVAWAGD